MYELNAVFFRVCAEVDNPAFLKKSALDIRRDFFKPLNAEMIERRNDNSVSEFKLINDLENSFFNSWVLVYSCFKLNVGKKSVNRLNKLKILSQGRNFLKFVLALKPAVSVEF